MPSILEYLEAHEGDMVEDLRAFVELETPTDDLSALNLFADFFAELAKTVAPAQVEFVRAADHGPHIRVRFGPKGPRPLLLLGHYDTVWPRGTLARLPFRLEAGRAYGPGSFDMKAGLVQGLWALRALAQNGDLSYPVHFLCTSDEEIGSSSARALIEEEAKAAASVFVLEPSAQGRLKTARKGVGKFVVDVHGRAAHAGLNPEMGVNAVTELARLIVYLSERAADQLTSHDVSVNIGVIRGGTRYNVVPAAASAELDVRAGSAAAVDHLSDLLHSFKPTHAEATITVNGGMIWPPMERSAATVELLRLAQRIGESLGMRLDEVSVGGASDGNFCAAVGAAVLDGLGAVGDGAHAEDEHVVTAEMPRRAALVAELMSQLGES